MIPVQVYDDGTRKHLTSFNIVNDEDSSILQTVWGIVVLVPF